MLTGGIKIKLVAFLVIGLIATTYLGARYVGINPFGRGYDVTVSLPDGGGIFKNGEVTYLGVPVGRIKDMQVTADGMQARVHIDSNATPIPANVSVVVANRSAIGEQYLNLIDGSGGGKRLADGDRLRGTAASEPPPVEDVLRSGRDFVGSVDKTSLKTVIDESYDASRGVGDDLSRLLSTTDDLVGTADTNFLVTSQLIQNSQTVLTTQAESADSIRGFSGDLNRIAQTLRTSDGDLRQLIGVTPAAAREIDRLFAEVGTPLGLLMSNLVSTAQVFGTNAGGLEDAMIRLPEAMSVGWATTSSKGLSLGLAQNYFDPVPCTSGYGGTQVRPGLSTSAGAPFNTQAGCTAPPSSGTDVRGPLSVPKSAAASASPRSGERTAGQSGAGSRSITQPDSLSDLMGGAS